MRDAENAPRETRTTRHARRVYRHFPFVRTELRAVQSDYALQGLVISSPLSSAVRRSNHIACSRYLTRVRVFFALVSRRNVSDYSDCTSVEMMKTERRNEEKENSKNEQNQLGMLHLYNRFPVIIFFFR